MNKILSFFSKQNKANQQERDLKQKSQIKFRKSEYDKIAKYHYQSKFTSINDRIHEKLSSKSPNKLINTSEDFEEMEDFGVMNKNFEEKEKIDLNKFDILIANFFKIKNI